MVSSSSPNGKCANEIQEELGQATAQNWTKNQIPANMITSRRGLLDERERRSRVVDFLRAFPKKAKYLKLGPSPSAKFWQFAEEKDEISRAVPSADQIHSSRFSISFVRKIDWAFLWQLSKEWIRNPMNMALFIWILFVAISGAILFMVMTGMLNGVLPRKSQRDGWFEVNNQILNALFTLMCLYQHPKRLYHLVLLIRWKPDDVLKLRKVYCKNGVYKPNEWVHMMVVVFLLNLNCFAQYALCGLNLGYPRSKRPAIGVAVCLSVSIGAPAFSAVYSMLSPLGRDYETNVDQEAQTLEGISSEVSKPAQLRRKSFERKYSFALQGNRRVPESNPQWIGGIYDLWDDISLAYLSVFCSCCVFGWNMEKLGFGNMYVHIMTFFLFCIAPFFIFNLAAVNIDNEAVREALGIAGILLCIFGLLYGGFWRIQMRKRFKLPGYTFCCDKPSVTDCFLWLCCCSCALAQEVRTADYYDIVEDKFFLKQTSDDNEFPVSPLRREDALPLYMSNPSSPYRGYKSPQKMTELSTQTRSPSRFAPGSPSSPHRGNSIPLEMLRESSTPTRSPARFAPGSPLPVVEEDESFKGSIDPMKPPVSPQIQREAGPMP
ncbi:hypothetical protein IEQ34_008870 [Dendrobium chrysotoxum]|uniref:PLAC8 motif-containing protein n=1 Tax=Dendrobium chrysotoxum TaxID=161865 RepID=A0AAV7GHN1_DENCH|nr:hypothetical protein IEQ34_008870 [Dendrobium chrysotoxum]